MKIFWLICPDMLGCDEFILISQIKFNLEWVKFGLSYLFIMYINKLV